MSSSQVLEITKKNQRFLRSLETNLSCSRHQAAERRENKEPARHSMASIYIQAQISSLRQSNAGAAVSAHTRHGRGKGGGQLLFLSCSRVLFQRHSEAARVRNDEKGAKPGMPPDRHAGKQLSVSCGHNVHTQNFACCVNGILPRGQRQDAILHFSLFSAACNARLSNRLQEHILGCPLFSNLRHAERFPDIRRDRLFCYARFGRRVVCVPRRSC